jgi:hypothetical protein
LDDPNTQAVGKGRAELLADFTESAKSISQNVPHLMSCARGAPAKLGIFAKETAASISTLVESARIAASGGSSKITPGAAKLLVRILVLLRNFNTH